MKTGLPRARTAPAASAVLLLLAACSAALISACSPRAERWNVVLVLVDTLRADHLSTYGYGRPTSPTLDRLAGDAARLSATSQAACTFPSVNSLLTSRYPARFFDFGLERALPAETPSLAEILASEGYRTRAATASSIVRNILFPEHGETGYARGFEVFDESCIDREAGCLVDQARDLLEGIDEPYFLYLHFMDPHSPYRPPTDAAQRFAGSPAPEVRPWARQGSIVPIHQALYEDGELEVHPAEQEHLVALYDEEIAYFDASFAKLWELLEERGEVERTLFVLASDHGEELLEHGDIAHCGNLIYQNLLSTPLIFRIPGVAATEQPSALVQNLDVVPTILDYLSLDPPGLELEGRSLRPLIERGRPVNRYAFSLQGLRRAVRDLRFKLVWNVESGEFQLYDLDLDPAESRDVTEEHPETFEELRDVLLRWVAAQEGEGDEGVWQADQVQRHLDALGYLATD